jgi:hypothetical protein
MKATEALKNTFNWKLIMESYSIIDLEGYAKAMRDGAASSFEKDYTENLDDFITITQVINMVKKNNLGLDEEGSYLINQDIFDDIFNDIRNWLYEVGLCKLAAKGFVDCAWDDESNEMVFWLANKDKTEIPAKPSKNNDD